MPHIHDALDFTVEVLIVCRGRVLLRKHDKYGIWLGVGGHIELGEDPNEAALREVLEEVGLDIELVGSMPGLKGLRHGHRELLPPRYMHRHPIAETHEHVAMVYFARSNSDTLSDPEGTGAETRWCSYEDLHELPLDPDICYYAQAALRELGS